MGWNNPPISWSEYERRLSGVPASGRPPGNGSGATEPAGAQQPMQATDAASTAGAPASSARYAELHAHSTFSFLDGASTPEALVEEASRLGLHALAITDHDGLYGAVRFAEAAEETSLQTVFGAELSLSLSAPQLGAADPEGDHLLVLARRDEGYHRLAAAITDAQLAGGEKGRPSYDLDQLAEHAGGHFSVLTGCRKGALRRALDRGDHDAASAALASLVDRFGRDRVVVELIDHGHPLDSRCNTELAQLAGAFDLSLIATGNVHYATPAERRIGDALAAVRARRSLDEMDGWLPASGGAFLRSGREMAARFADFPGAIERTVELADDLAFRLRSLRPGLPKQQVPEGHTPMSWLRHLVWEAVPLKYPKLTDDDRARIERELAVIEEKDFSGYFLIVHDIVRFARSRGILCQGRGSAANSAVCYLLGITAVDSIFYRLPFERFLSSMRNEEPDIDVDFDSDRREEVIQYVYEKYGRRNAAQVANVISYRPKFAVRDMAKALGFSPGQQDAWSKQVDRWGALQREHTDIPDQVLDLADAVLTFPRHLGIHSGGMVLTDRPVGEVVPIEHARMPGRTVLQWDKDDCAWMGLVKFDLLGLGMLAALQYTIDLVAESTGEQWTLDTLPREEPGVYDMLCRADAIGVFQVESRAQMGMLPRLRPRCFYDLVIEIALIRPGPIQGGAVHPYIRRRTGAEPVTYPHPLLVESLERTLGIPLFQEQLMQMAMAVGGCTAEDADHLRRAMGSKRGIEKVSKLRDKLYAGMAANGLPREVADSVYAKIEAFANFGFAESHSISFALLVYASSWFKLHYPAAFLAALLRAQPMGFYSPQSLTADARRHGVRVLRADILRSGVDAGLEPLSGTADAASATGDDACLALEQPPVDEFDEHAAPDTERHRRDGAFAVRLGLADVRSLGRPVAERIVSERTRGGPYRSMEDLVARTGLNTKQLEALATADAFEVFDLNRRQALWNSGTASQHRPEYLTGATATVQPPLFASPDLLDDLAADLSSTGISPDDHPLRHLREALQRRGVLSSSDLGLAEPDRRIEVAGVVTHRQRPATASGVTFLNLEDEHGLMNVVCSVGVWQRHRRVARESGALIVRGILQRSAEGVTSVLADRFEQLPLVTPHRSRDFH
ncbi:error-prone DNA polymerase [Ruicaihuangia caeni]|uniref:error-prone DNA polymerase n=1 Tax=Ruicaihuangia caeni TaxID=3042517 RepID=UPI00338D62F4